MNKYLTHSFVNIVKRNEVKFNLLNKKSLNKYSIKIDFHISYVKREMPVTEKHFGNVTLGKCLILDRVCYCMIRSVLSEDINPLQAVTTLKITLNNIFLELFLLQERFCMAFKSNKISK